MMNLHEDSSTVEQERLILQALCTQGPKFLKAAESLLAGYNWQEPIHQVIYTCLTSFSGRSPMTIRERLAECATRKGFPDVEWEEFFPACVISTSEFAAIIRQLLEVDAKE